MYTLHTSPTPNGWKISALLEELQVPYDMVPINLMEGTQKTPEFLKLNPNGRIPALVVNATGESIFESGAIMIYLAETHGQLIGKTAQQRMKIIQWLMFQMAGIGPMQGQANVFFRYFPEKIQSVIDRYQNESRRLFEVVETQLEGRDFLVDDFSIADIACWSWMRIHEWSGVNMDGLSNVTKWLERIESRPACKKGANIPERKDVKTEEAQAEVTKSGQSILQK